MSMYANCIVITNRHLVTGPYMEQLEKVCRKQPKAMILREKDLEELEYDVLARKVCELGKRYDVDVILHHFLSVAITQKVKRIHMNMGELRLNKNALGNFEQIGVSVHSVEEAKEAEQLGATYILAGHVFDTDCKKGVPGRGMEYLRQVVKAVSIPVYGIGGMEVVKIPYVLETGASGVGMMSHFMKLK